MPSQSVKSKGSVALRAWRLEQGVSQQSVAETLKCQQNRVSRFETGAIRPTLIEAFQVEESTGGAVKVLDWLVPAAE